MKKLFITGGTGFLGKYLLRNLVNSFDTIYVLSRKELPEEFNQFKNIILVRGDISSLQIINSKEDRDAIIENVTHVIHAAAFYDLTADHKTCFLNNVLGTKNIINLINKIKNLKVVNYISTIAVAGENTHLLLESNIDKMPKFKDHYSSTKYLAEKLMVESFNQQYRLNILRPGIIVGDSQSGYIEKIDGPYYFIELFKKLKLLKHTSLTIPLAFNPDSMIPIIPVDHCARLISSVLNFENDKNVYFFHLISDEVPSIMQFLNDINARFEFKINYLPVRKNPVHEIILSRLGIPKEVIPFMFSKIDYDKTVTYKLLPEIRESKYSHYKESLLK